MQDLHIILDADGVFMNEMTYWRTALVVALDHAALPVTEPATWRRWIGPACKQNAFSASPRVGGAIPTGIWRRSWLRC
jgi:phosphoglycolate phosphatase-like HAD superfamily hydrolase